MNTFQEYGILPLIMIPLHGRYNSSKLTVYSARITLSMNVDLLSLSPFTKEYDFAASYKT